jgi:hypothetical protein
LIVFELGMMGNIEFFTPVFPGAMILPSSAIAGVTDRNETVLCITVKVPLDF